MRAALLVWPASQCRYCYSHAALQKKLDPGLASAHLEARHPATRCAAFLYRTEQTVWGQHGQKKKETIHGEHESLRFSNVGSSEFQLCEHCVRIELEQKNACRIQRWLAVEEYFLLPFWLWRKDLCLLSSSDRSSIPPSPTACIESGSGSGVGVGLCVDVAEGLDLELEMTCAKSVGGAGQEYFAVEVEAQPPRLLTFCRLCSSTQFVL